MNKPTTKNIKAYFKTIDANFSKLIDAVIWYEKNDMDDWGMEIIHKIEDLPSNLEIKYLFDDIVNRKDCDLQTSLYQMLWFGLINYEEVNEDRSEIVKLLEKHSNKELVLNFLLNLSKDKNVNENSNIKKIIKSCGLK